MIILKKFLRKIVIFYTERSVLSACGELISSSTLVKSYLPQSGETSMAPVVPEDSVDMLQQQHKDQQRLHQLHQLLGGSSSFPSRPSTLTGTTTTLSTSTSSPAMATGFSRNILSPNPSLPVGAAASFPSSSVSTVSHFPPHFSSSVDS